MENKLALVHADLWSKSNVGTIDQRQDLLKQILAAKQEGSVEIQESNAGCWRSRVEYENLDWLFTDLKTIVQNASEYYFDIDEVFRSRVVDKQVKFSYWTNVNEYNASNVLHTHNKDTFTATYYLQGSSTGTLNFVNPANMTLECSNISPMTRSVAVQPEDGDLFVWPGWVPHEVVPNPSQRQRINIPFSIQVS